MPQSAKKYALLIGNDRYADFPELKVPAADVAGLRRVLEDPAIGGFDQVRISMNPDLRHAQEAIGELFAERARDDLLLLYFSGHGERDGGKGALYLALADSRRDRLRATAVPADFIKTEMDESPAGRQVLILDCCYAGAFGEKGGAIDADCFGGIDKQPRAVPGTDDEAEGYGRVTLTSSTAAQTSWEGNRVIEGVERSLFTHFLIRGLETGEAAEGRARVSVAQLYRYAHRGVTQATAAAGRKRMTPQCWVHRQQGELILARNPHPPVRPPLLEDLVPADLLTDLAADNHRTRLGAVRELAELMRQPALEPSVRAVLKARLSGSLERDFQVRASIAEALSPRAQPSGPGARIERGPSSGTAPPPSRPAEPAAPGRGRSGSGRWAALLLGCLAIGVAVLVATKVSRQPGGAGAPFATAEIPKTPEIGTGLGASPPATATAATRDPFGPSAPAADNRDPFARSETATDKSHTDASQPPKPFYDRLKDGSLGPKMVPIPAGSFLMGSPEGEPERDKDEQQHRVTIEKPFAIGQYELTVADFRRFVEDRGYRTEAEQGDGCYGFKNGSWKKDKAFSWRAAGFEQADDSPVLCVSWNDALAYTEWLSDQTGKRYRLPTEAEWEYAARAGTETPFFTGNCISTDQANYAGTLDYNNCGAKTGIYPAKTLPVGTLAPNSWGLYDMAGNVWEWTCSAYSDPYDGKEKVCTGKNNANFGPNRAIRGGSWNYWPAWLRSADRTGYAPSNRGDDLGFRLAQDL